MLQVAITGATDDRLRRYVQKKISRLDTYIPRNARPATRAEVFLEEIMARGKKRCLCRVIVHLPAETVVAHSETINMYAAMDIVEEKIKRDLRAYKEQHAAPRLHRRIMNRFAKHQ